MTNAEELKKYLQGRDPGDEDDQMDVPRDEVVFVGTPGEHNRLLADQHKGMFRPGERIPVNPGDDVRFFETGATRNTDDDQLDYEGFLSPLVLLRFAEYMHQHRVQADGTLRSSDNWQKGIPVDSYASSLIRHMMDVWLNHRNFEVHSREDLETALCAIIFNAQGYLFEVMNGRG